VKAVILAGGLGSRLSEETHLKPKPMVQIGEQPILWHIMKIFSAYGVNDFVICLGYKGYLIKEFFANYRLHNSDVTIDIARNEIEVHRADVEPWRVTLVDTGESTMTAGRLRRVAHHLREEAEFFLTYGDGVADINISALHKLHRESNTLATVTAVQPPGRFGSMSLADSAVTSFHEKPDGDGGWINGGYFVMKPEVTELISGDREILELGLLPTLTARNQLSAYRHRGFWQPMDTLRDKVLLDGMWEKNQAPWKVWE